jgi:hypothetical protein
MSSRQEKKDRVSTIGQLFTPAKYKKNEVGEGENRFSLQMAPTLLLIEISKLQ